jgi:hypothetical protein
MKTASAHPELLTVVTTIGALDRRVPCDFEKWRHAKYLLKKRNKLRLGMDVPSEVSLQRFSDSIDKITSFCAEPSKGIRRSEVLSMGENLRSQTPTVRAIDLFIASMIWGNGLTGYGRYRTCIALNIQRNDNSPIELINRAGEEAACGNLEMAYSSLTNGLWSIGPAFGTKFLYFASPPASNALIFDGLVASWKGSELPWTADKSTAWTWDWSTYQNYRKWCIDQIQLLIDSGHPRVVGTYPLGRPVGPDVVEAAIFSFQNQNSSPARIK